MFVSDVSKWANRIIPLSPPPRPHREAGCDCTSQPADYKQALKARWWERQVVGAGGQQWAVTIVFAGQGWSGWWRQSGPHWWEGWNTWDGSRSSAATPPFWLHRHLCRPQWRLPRAHLERHTWTLLFSFPVSHVKASHDSMCYILCFRQKCPKNICLKAFDNQ